MDRQITKKFTDMSVRSHRTQNYIVIWVDASIDLTKQDFQNSIAKLRSVVNDITTCATLKECIDCLNSLDEGKAFVISSGALGPDLVAKIHNMPKVDAIYIFCGNKARHEPWASEWPKIQGVYTSIKPICESLKKVAHASDHNDIPMSFLPKQSIGSISSSKKENLDQLPPTFMYSVIFKETILEIKDEHEKQMNDLVAYCNKKNVSTSQVTKFQEKYREHTPVWWYTCEMFLYGMLNQALRTLDMEGMVKMGFFIRHLHVQLEQLYKKQSNNFQKEFTVFRGQGLSQEDFRSLSESKGGLLSFNNFLSTSKVREISMKFVRRTINKNKDCIGVLFVMSIDPKKISTSETPFASVDDESAMVVKEQEILFTTHTVFRVIDINQTTENSRLYEVQLTMTGDNDPELTALNVYIKEDIKGLTGWYRMGELMLQVGHFDQAEELYNRLLDEATSDADKAHTYHELGRVKWRQGKYAEEIPFYEKYLTIKLKTLRDDDISLTTTYTNIGLAYYHMGDYSNALRFYEKSIKIQEKDQSDQFGLAVSYNSIGGLYSTINDYSKALEFYEKSLKIREKVLPSNHPGLANSYNNIGAVYDNMGDYWKALEFYLKDLQIREKALPSSHPSLAITYNSIGGVYDHIGDYLKALEFFEKSLKIKEKVLPLAHPDLAIFYNNIGVTYYKIGDYLKALEFYEKSHKINEETLPLTHPNLATSYSNIGSAHYNLGDYLQAINYIKRSTKIWEDSNITNHSLSAFPYKWLGRIYRSMKEYSKSLENFEKCLEIRNHSLTEMHPNKATALSDIGDVHRLMGDYEKALNFHQKALEIQENVKCNPLDCATTFVNLGETHREMKDYSIALKYYEKSLKIYEEILPKDHPDLAVVYHNMSKLYLSTREYSTAMKYVQQAVDIAQVKLPSTHPNLLEYRETFEKIRKTQ